MIVEQSYIICHLISQPDPCHCRLNKASNETMTAKLSGAVMTDDNEEKNPRRPNIADDYSNLDGRDIMEQQQNEGQSSFSMYCKMIDAYTGQNEFWKKSHFWWLDKLKNSPSKK
jgi:hypothetical protein